MTSGAPWSVKGIDPKAREIAKDLARRSGMTLGEWLNRMIVEGEAPSPADDEPVQQPYAQTFSDRHGFNPDPVIMQTPRPSTFAGSPPRYELAGHPADEVGRVTEALERLSARIEAAELRSAQAINGIDESVRGVLTRIDLSEREQVAVAARFEGAVDDIRTEQTRAVERLRRIENEAAGPRSVEALRALEGTLGKVAGHLYDGEERTRLALAAIEARVAGVEQVQAPDSDSAAEAVVEKVLARLEAAETATNDALRDLGASFVKLDGRLRRVETEAGPSRLEALAATLGQRMDAARQEMAEKLKVSAEGGVGRLERRLTEMSAHVQAAEQQSAQAIERMGREMASMADTFTRRVDGVERRGAEAMEQVSGQVARVTATVDQRFNQIDAVHAQALEKLGGEVARIAERLSDRIANSERRGAQAVDDVSEQMARVSERITERQERGSSELADRIRQSEERTARLLDEAAQKIDAGLAAAERKLADQVAAAPAPVAARRVDLDPFAPDPFPVRGGAIPEDAFAPRLIAPAEVPPADFKPAATESEPDFEPEALTVAVADAEAFEPAPSAKLEASEPFAAAQAFARPSEDAGSRRSIFDEDDFEAAPRDARDPFAAHDAFQPIDDLTEEEDDFVAQAAPLPPVLPVDDRGAVVGTASVGLEEPAAPATTRDVIAQARAAARAASQPEKPRSGFAGIGGGSSRKPKQPASARMMSVLAATGGVAAVSILAVSLVTSQQGKDGAPGRVQDSLKIAAQDRKDAQVTANGAKLSTGLDANAPMAMALGPNALTPIAPATPAAGDNPAALYAEARTLVEANDPKAVDLLTRSANLGYAPAQYEMGKMYENGTLGAKKDLVEARRWTERAAEGGDAKAMYNLANAYFNGAGGTRNTTTAAQWFQKAAELGMTDAQYNLGRIYEEGYGVKQNGAEAYKWFLIASRDNDAESRASAARVRKALTPEQQAAAERSAAGFRAARPNPGLAASPTISVKTAQRALSILGYYQGPQDGVSSPALKLAIAAWQKDRKMQPTGALDQPTLQGLSTY